MSINLSKKISEGLLKKNSQKYSYINKQNHFSIRNTMSIIKVILLSYKGILGEINIFKKQLINLHVKIKNIMETNMTHDIIKKEYDIIIEQFYNNLLNFIKLEIIDKNGIKRKTLFSNNISSTRNILLTYETFDGIVINNDIAITDNISILSTDQYFEIKIAETIVLIPYSISINNDFSFEILLNIIDNNINLIFGLEREIDKNIFIIRESLLLIKTIQNTINTNYKSL